MSKYLIALFFIVLIIGAGTIMELSFQEVGEGANLIDVSDTYSSKLPEEEGMFRQSDNTSPFQGMGYDDAKSRSLTTYYDNRAYNGAPPTIPHPLLTEKGIGGKSCLQCHENGGYVKQFKAYAPITPHPEFGSCKQCHVPQKTKTVFKGSDFASVVPPAIHQQALEGSPPVIPHGLQLRTNCLACHSGPAAPKEIRVSHPERINCRQCHVPSNTSIQPFWLIRKKYQE